MEPIHIRHVATGEHVRATGTQVTAFSADPIMRWLWPEPQAYLDHFPALVRGFGGGAFDNHGAHVTEDFAGASLWLPPGVHPDEEALETLMRTTVAEPTRSEVMEMLEQMAASHPKEPHWHLAVIGVDPAYRSRGIGAQLLDFALREIDELGLHAYLESSNPRNIRLYERHGFEVIREIQIGDSPPCTPMVRRPR